MRFGSMRCALSAGKAEAPQSISSAAFAVSRKKQVLSLPPEPKASPQPAMVSFIVASFSGARAGPRRDDGVPALHVATVLRHGDARRLHEIDRAEHGDVGDRETFTGDELA